MLTIIAAYDQNKLIGYNNTIPWHYAERYPEVQPAVKKDMKFFRTQTLNHPVIMGRTTFQSLPGKLKKRSNIVLSARFPKESIEEPDYSLTYCTSLEEGITKAKQIHTDGFILGGASVYAQAIPIVDRMLLTEFKFKFEPGLGIKVFFPDFNVDDWKVSVIEEDETFSIKEYTR